MSAVTTVLPKINTRGCRTGGKPRSPVRRNSVRVDRSAGFYRPMSRGEPKRIMRAAEAWAEAHRVKGVSPLTASTLRILETALFAAMDWTTGQLDWSYAQFADAAGRCIDTVWRALKQLENDGWLERMRRCAPNDDTSPGAAPFIQITNAYRLKLPEKVASWVKAHPVRGWGPVPDDHAHALERATEANAAQETENHQLVGERELARRQAQREARQPTWVTALRPAKPAPIHQPTETKEEMVARIRAAAASDEWLTSGDSD
ncbi:MAG: hypothetical protein ACXU82_03605 [Caulobacteraceae bacterium]